MRHTMMAAAAAALFATPVLAGEIHVALAGKSAEQVHSEIARAAAELCWAEHKHDELMGLTYPACVRASVKNAVQQIGDAQLKAYAAENPRAWKQYAAR